MLVPGLVTKHLKAPTLRGRSASGTLVAWAATLLVLGSTVEGATPGAKAGQTAIKPTNSDAEPTDDDETAPYRFFDTEQLWELPHMLPERWFAPLTQRGIDYLATYSTELVGNPVGGLKGGMVFSGVLEAGLLFDTEKLFGWPGATVYISSLMSHGGNLSDSYLGDLYAGSSMESENSIRLYEMWVDQSLLDESLSLRVGQLAADREFFGTDVGTLFMNTAFSWPAVFSLSVDAASFPVAALGARLRLDVSGFRFQSAVFTGRPEPLDEYGDAINANGVYYNFDNGAMIFGEASYLTGTENGLADYPGVYKLGGWVHTGTSYDQRYDDTGLSLASPFSDQNPRSLHGNRGAYGVAEQKIWRPPHAVGEQGLSVFGRAATVPNDRNLVSLSLNGGAYYVGPFRARPHDVTGLGVSYNRVGDSARGLGADVNHYNSLFHLPKVPLPDYEVVAEWTYRFEIKPWWYLQPSVQCIIHPGGSSAIPNALVLGVRNTLSF